MRFIGDTKEIEKGAAILCSGFNAEASVYVKRSDNGIRIYDRDGSYYIEYEHTNEFFRALAILTDKIKNGENGFLVKMKRQFDTCGLMIDVSRNAVPKTDTLKRIIVYMAKMGFNMLMLYTEDTFKMEKYPYFGYMRGAYTEAEIKSVVDFCGIFGIEVVPCIQTLAHLSRTLRWNYAADMKDTDDILLIDEEKTYEFIEEMIKTSRKYYKSAKIHIGMDEAHMVGLGKYLSRHGYTNRFELLTKHLSRVIEITGKYGFTPIMWSDMFFRLGSETGDYYDKNARMPENISELIPENISLVYWDYTNEDENLCDFMIKAHKQMGRNIIFAGGLCTWNRLCANNAKTKLTAKAALSACRKNNIRSVFTTVWGDDGAECSIFTALPGMQLYAEYNYYDTVDEMHLADMFKICTGLDIGNFSVFDTDSFKACTGHDAEVSKQVLYSDILLGLVDKNLALLDLKTHYKKLLNSFDSINTQNELSYLFEYQKQLITVLYKKAGIGTRLTKAYLSGNHTILAEISAEIANILSDVKKLHELAANVWYKDNKAFGFELLDHRLGGLEARIMRSKIRIENYLSGQNDSIEELDEERLWYTDTQTPFVYGHENKLSRP